MSIRIGVLANRLSGWCVSFGDQMFGAMTDTLLGVTSFYMCNHLQRARVEIMDGVIMGCLRGGGGVPTVCTGIWERIGASCRRPARDTATYEALHQRDQLAADGSVPEAIRTHLDSGLVAGSRSLLSMPSMTSIARRG